MGPVAAAREDGIVRVVCAIALIVLGASPVFALSDRPYLAPTQIDALGLIAPPPSADSELQKRDLAAVLAAQVARTPAVIKRAQADRDFTGFATVLGDNFTPAKVPIAAEFIRKVTRETGAQVDRVKECWQRQRPFVVSTAVRPPEGAVQTTENNPGATMSSSAAQAVAPPCRSPQASAYSYAYPSGAANVGMTAAILLAAMVPEKRGELFLRAWEYGENRVLLGLHFPSDIEAGRILATATLAVMMQNPAFQTDLAAAKTELRSALGRPR